LSASNGSVAGKINKLKLIKRMGYVRAGFPRPGSACTSRLILWATTICLADLVGHYDMPGWTANGIEPWGLQMDPIGADGNLFYKGFFNLLLGLYRYVSGDTKWSRSFTIIGDGANTFTYTHSSINHLLTRQWAARQQGCHCENTKIWPY